MTVKNVIDAEIIKGKLSWMKLALVIFSKFNFQF